MTWSAMAEEKGGAAMAFTVVNKANTPTELRNICSHCQKTGHDITFCFQLNGYPSGEPRKENCRTPASILVVAKAAIDQAQCIEGEETVMQVEELLQ